MSQWHRENPELAGTDADPWMRHKSYRTAAALNDLQRRGEAAMRKLGINSIEEAEFQSSHVCNECGAITCEVPACLLCGSDRIVVREP